MKLVRITATAIIAIILSWAPYSFVSLGATLTRKQVIELWEAEIPELLAKASVIYNPVIYIVMSSRFRASLFQLLRLRTRVTVPITNTSHHRNLRVFTGLKSDRVRKL